MLCESSHIDRISGQRYCYCCAPRTERGVTDALYLILLTRVTLCPRSAVRREAVNIERENTRAFAMNAQ